LAVGKLWSAGDNRASRFGPVVRRQAGTISRRMSVLVRFGSALFSKAVSLRLTSPIRIVKR